MQIVKDYDFNTNSEYRYSVCQKSNKLDRILAAIYSLILKLQGYKKIGA